VDEKTWTFHLRSGDYSRWLREMIKDPDLASEIARLETDADVAPAAARREALAAIRRRYAA
jgi:hypothetical protein